MSNKLLMIAVVLAVMVSMTGVALAHQLNGEKYLNESLDDLYGTGHWVQITDYTFDAGPYTVVSIIRDQFSGYPNPIGYYNATTGTLTELFANDTITTSITFSPGTSFGLYTNTSNDTAGYYTFYTQQSKNPDGLNHTKIFRVDTDNDNSMDAFVIGFEDLYGGGDHDFQDVVVQLKGEGLNSVSVPEFPTIAMPIAAVIGLVFFFQHRNKKDE